jgi:hypothetical protein
MSDRTGDQPTNGDAPGDPAVQDLKATIEAIRTDVDRLAAIEATKATLDADDPAMNRLSDDAVHIADRIGRETRAERQLSSEVS